MGTDILSKKLLPYRRLPFPYPVTEELPVIWPEIVTHKFQRIVLQ
jgi:hypothetical protein